MLHRPKQWGTKQTKTLVHSVQMWWKPSESRLRHHWLPHVVPVCASITLGVAAVADSVTAAAVVASVVLVCIVVAAAVVFESFFAFCFSFNVVGILLLFFSSDKHQTNE